MCYLQGKARLQKAAGERRNVRGGDQNKISEETVERVVREGKGVGKYKAQVD